MATQSKLSTGLLANWIAKVLAFITALFLVLAIRFLNITSRVVHIPIDIILPESTELVPVSLIPDSIDVVITGNDSIIYLVDPSQIKASADFSSADKGDIVRKAVKLEYDHDIYTQNSLTIQAKPSTIRILFEEVKP